MPRQTFKIVLIKPSHYDAKGYVIQWWRSTIPSNSLASVYGLLRECAEAKVLGPDVDIDIDAYDECNTIIDIKGTIRKIHAAGAGFVGLVGVQSNQYPSAFHYMDEALTPPKADQNDNFVEVYATKIPKTHGAPTKRPAAAEVIEAAE